MSPRPRLVITPQVNERGRHEAESLVTPHKVEGGKRKGRNMKRKRIPQRKAWVTLENLQAGRDNDGVFIPALKCVSYIRKAE